MIDAEIGEKISTMEKLADRHDGWTVLYREPISAEYWELDYPRNEMHGGGPRRLRRVDSDHVATEYGSVG